MSLKTDWLPNSESKAAPGLGQTHEQHVIGPEQLAGAVEQISQFCETSENAKKNEGHGSKWKSVEKRIGIKNNAIQILREIPRTTAIRKDCFCSKWKFVEVPKNNAIQFLLTCYSHKSKSVQKYFVKWIYIIDY